MPRNHRNHPRLLRIHQLPRRLHALHRPVRRRRRPHRMQHQRHIPRHHHVGKVPRHVRLLHIAEQVQLHRRMHRLRHRAHPAPQLAERRHAHRPAQSPPPPRAARPHPPPAASAPRICPPSAITCAFCAPDLPRQHRQRLALRLIQLRARPRQPAAFMLNESSTTTSSSLSLASTVLCRKNGRANASASSSTSSARSANSSRYRSLRCRTELCVPCSKNISELTGRGTVVCLRSRCTNTGSPTASNPRQKPRRQKSHHTPPAIEIVILTLSIAKDLLLAGGSKIAAHHTPPRAARPAAPLAPLACRSVRYSVSARSSGLSVVSS